MTDPALSASRCRNLDARIDFEYDLVAEGKFGPYDANAGDLVVLYSKSQRALASGYVWGHCWPTRSGPYTDRIVISAIHPGCATLDTPHWIFGTTPIYYLQVLREQNPKDALVIPPEFSKITRYHGTNAYFVYMVARDTGHKYLSNDAFIKALVEHQKKLGGMTSGRK